VVTHLAYRAEDYDSAAECLAGIRVYLERGWELAEIDAGGGGRRFRCLFRREGVRPESQELAAGPGSR
jgi:hypothetical protein